MFEFYVTTTATIVADSREEADKMLADAKQDKGSWLANALLSNAEIDAGSIFL